MMDKYFKYRENKTNFRTEIRGGTATFLTMAYILALNPMILFTNSVLNPFITDITIIKTATPKLIPRKENAEIIFTKPSFFLVFKYLNTIFFSNIEINFLNSFL